MATICKWASRRGIAIVEDCCHTFGTRVHGRLCGTFGKFAFMSGQWNKPFPTGLGGMLLVNDPELAEKVEALIAAEATPPGRLRNAQLALQILLYERLVTPQTTAVMTAAYRALNTLGLVAGSSSVQELSGVMPDGYFSTMAPAQIHKGLRELARIGENIRHRTELTRHYHREVPRLGFCGVAVEGVEELPLVRYPVRMANKAEVLRKAARRGFEIGSWFEVPLHPAGTRMEDFGYLSRMCPRVNGLAGRLSICRRT